MLKSSFLRQANHDVFKPKHAKTKGFDSKRGDARGTCRHTRGRRQRKRKCLYSSPRMNALEIAKSRPAKKRRHTQTITPGEIKLKSACIIYTHLHTAHSCAHTQLTSIYVRTSTNDGHICRHQERKGGRDTVQRIALTLAPGRASHRRSRSSAAS